MSDQFLQTANVRNAVAAMTALLSQPPELPSLAAIHGQAGRGKTEAMIHYAVKNKAHYLVPKVGTRQRPLLNDLYAVLKDLKQAKFPTVDKAYRACLRTMYDNPATPIIIDEADRIMKDITLAETLRDLNDRTGCPIVFVGTDLMLHRLMQYEQLSSRLTQVVSFEPMSIEEVVQAAAQLRGLKLDDGAAEELHKGTRGFIRDVVVALDHITRAVRGSGGQPPTAEMVADIARGAIKRAA